MGCLRSLGCLVALGAITAAAVMYRAEWMPLVDRATGRAPAAAPGALTWERVTVEGTARAREAMTALSARSGPVFANVKPGDLASLLYDTLARELPPSATNVAVAGLGDTLFMRADVRLADFGGAAALGPLGKVLGDLEPVQFGGALEVVRPGLARYRITSLRLGDVSVPSAMIPRLVRNATRVNRPKGVGDDALSLPLPPSIGDIRVHGDKITLYKTVP